MKYAILILNSFYIRNGGSSKEAHPIEYIIVQEALGSNRQFFGFQKKSITRFWLSAKSHAYYGTMYYGFSLSSDGRAWTSTTPGNLLVISLYITTESRAPSVSAGSCYGQKQVRHCKSIER